MIDFDEEQKLYASTRRKLARQFVLASGTNQIENFLDLCLAIDSWDGWEVAFRAIVRSSTPVRDEIKQCFARVYIEHAAGIRITLPDDILFIKACWQLMPTYQGPSMTLYRGESASNRRCRRYGLSWSSSAETARGFADGSLGKARNLDDTVVLKAIVAPEGFCVPFMRSIPILRKWSFSSIDDR